MGDRLGLRLRFALFFAALGLGGALIAGASLWFAYSRYAGPSEGYLLAGLATTFGLIGLAAWVGFLFDENVARPIQTLASDLNTRARAPVDAEIDPTPARYLGALAPAANALHVALSEARAAQERAVAAETARINRDKALFAALLRDLSEAAVVLTPDHRIMLYNRVALDLLGPIGLDRPIGQFVRSEPLDLAITRLAAKQDRGEAPAERFLAATTDGARFLLGRVSPIASDQGQIGHVLIFHDATDDLTSHAERDHLFNSLLEKARRPAAAISALLDVLGDDAGMPAEIRVTFNEAMQEELGRLFQSLRDASQKHGSIAQRHWPMSEVAAEDIFDALRSRNFPLAFEGGQHFLRCDGFAIIGLLTRVMNGMTATATRSQLILRAEPHDHETWITISWVGDEAADGQIDSWISGPVSEAYGLYSGRDVLEGHRTEIWSETLGDGHRIVLPLATAGAPVLAPQDARPEFYDFDLPADDFGGELADRPLSDLTFVVFDTETTGLSPRSGDEIVQISGLRIVNGRILSGEPFDTYVNPGRRIPPASTKVHGITDEMVAAAPDIRVAGQKFHDFCDGAVLVAHNAPFDLAFLRLKEDQIGRKFRNPTLCTVLLSAALFEHTGAHTLDALAERFGVTIPPDLRHTALGDATATAQVFLGMLDVLKAEGINTLGEAIAAGNRMRQIRRAQDY